MKMKKKVYSIVTAVLLIATTVFVGTRGAIPVQAASVQVSINGTELQDGSCYVFDTITNQMDEYDPATGSNSNYISYNNGVMEVYGNVEIGTGGKDTTEILYIKNGTLKLTGGGNLTIDSGAFMSKEAIITGTADAALTTDAYTGDLYFRAYDGSAIIQGLASVDLRTTGDIKLAGSHINGDAFISAGSVNLEAKDFTFGLKATMNVKHLIEATDMQNGKITLTKTGTTNALRLLNGSTYRENINVSDAFFKGKDVFVSSKGSDSSSVSISFEGNTIAEGNLKIEATDGVDIKTQGNLVNGNLEIHSATKRDVILKSKNGSLSTGNTDIDAIEASTFLEGEDAAIKGNATIKTAVLEISSAQNAAIAGNADLRTTAGRIVLSGSEGYSVIAGNTIQLNANNGNVNISRTGSGATDTPPILGGTVQSDRGAIHYNDGGTQWMQMMETGKVYYVDNCEHPIVDGSTGGCLVCGAKVACVELIGKDGTSKGEFVRTFGGGSAYDVMGQVSAGDTIKFITDVYCPAQVASMRMSSKDVTIDLNGHTLTVQCISSGPNLTIKNGAYVGDIKGDTAGILNLRNVKATLRSLDWNDTTNGVNLENSQVTIAAAAGQTGTCRLEKLTMDENSKLVLRNATGGINNAGQNSLEDSFGSIRDFLPKGYSLARITGTNSRNTIVDSNGNIATDIVLRYRRMTDEDMNIVLNATSLVYDKTAKEPEFLVTYEGQDLVKGTDYTVAYTNNVNAGNAMATITGIGTYHGSVQLPFTIEKGNQTAPTGLNAVKASKSGALDGAIENLSVAMEYSIDKVNWTAVTSGTRVNGLVAGDYYVRYAATENYNASPATKVVVGTADAASSESASTSDATTAGANGTAAAEVVTDEKGAKSVKTGDEAPLGMILLLMFSAAGVTFAAIAGNKKKHS